MGIDIHIGVNNTDAIYTLDFFSSPPEYHSLYGLSRTFCNFMSRRDVIDHEPELEQIGRITGISVSLLYDLNDYPDDEWLETMLEYAEDDAEKEQILHKAGEDKKKLTGNIDRVLDLITTLIDKLSSIDNLPQLLLPTNFDTLPNSEYFLDFNKDKGDGWGCWATASGPPPTATVWFTFVPNRTARWELSPIFVFHGFYIMRADDGIFTCKFSAVEMEAKIDIFQYFWKGPKTYKLIDEDKDDVDTVGFFDRTEWIWDTTILRSGDPVWVKVDVSVDAIASGGGSYAEINFSDGAANYIEPLLMTTQTV